MKHIFIDANILVSYFEVSPESLAELRELTLLGGASEAATIWLPKQVKREFWKKRESNTRKQLKVLENNALLPSAPLLVRERPEFKELLQKAREFEALRKTVVDAVRLELEAEKTPADEAIRDLLELATTIDSDEDEIFEKARRRAECCLPPGKLDHLGDRLNWEALSAGLPPKAELHIVSNDDDYRRDSGGDEANPYLKHEWSSRNGGDLHVWRRITQFISANFPDCKQAVDEERQVLCGQLLDTKKFADTHAAIRRLRALGEPSFSPSQVRLLLGALVENSQIYWIASDQDVRRFYKGLLDKYGAHVDSALREAAEALITSGA